MKNKNKRGIFVILLIYVIFVLAILLVALLVRRNRSNQMAGQDETSDYLITSTAISLPSLSPTTFLTDSPTLTATEISSHTIAPSEMVTYTFTSSPTVTETSQFTPTPSHTITSNPTLTSTPTPNPGLVWEGAWTGYFGEEIGSVYEMEIEVTVEGNQIEAAADFRGSIMIFSGRFSDDFRLITGTWSDPPVSGNFTWYLQSDGQFVGNRDDLFAYCGSRGGQPIPDPCYGP